MRSKRFVQEWISTFFSTISFYIIFFKNQTSLIVMRIQIHLNFWSTFRLETTIYCTIYSAWLQVPNSSKPRAVSARWTALPRRCRWAWAMRLRRFWQSDEAFARRLQEEERLGMVENLVIFGGSKKVCVCVCVCKISIDVHYFIVCTMESSTMEFDFLSALFPARFTVAVLCT